MVHFMDFGCILLHFTSRFATLCLAFWCKIHCVLVQNTRQNGAKRKVRSMIIHSNGINKTFQKH